MVVGFSRICVLLVLVAGVGVGDGLYSELSTGHGGVLGLGQDFSLKVFNLTDSDTRVLIADRRRGSCGVMRNALQVTTDAGHQLFFADPDQSNLSSLGPIYTYSNFEIAFDLMLPSGFFPRNSTDDIALLSFDVLGETVAFARVLLTPSGVIIGQISGGGTCFPYCNFSCDLGLSSTKLSARPSLSVRNGNVSVSGGPRACLTPFIALIEPRFDVFVTRTLSVVVTNVSFGPYLGNSTGTLLVPAAKGQQTLDGQVTWDSLVFDSSDAVGGYYRVCLCIPTTFNTSHATIEALGTWSDVAQLDMYVADAPTRQSLVSSWLTSDGKICFNNVSRLNSAFFQGRGAPTRDEYAAVIQSYTTSYWLTWLNSHGGYTDACEKISLRNGYEYETDGVADLVIDDIGWDNFQVLTVNEFPDIAHSSVDVFLGDQSFGRDVLVASGPQYSNRFLLASGANLGNYSFVSVFLSATSGGHYELDSLAYRDYATCVPTWVTDVSFVDTDSRPRYIAGTLQWVSPVVSDCVLSVSVWLSADAYGLRRLFRLGQPCSFPVGNASLPISVGPIHPTVRYIIVYTCSAGGEQALGAATPLSDFKTYPCGDANEFTEEVNQFVVEGFTINVMGGYSGPNDTKLVAMPGQTFYTIVSNSYLTEQDVGSFRQINSATHTCSSLSTSMSGALALGGHVVAVYTPGSTPSLRYGPMVDDDPNSLGLNVSLCFCPNAALLSYGCGWIWVGSLQTSFLNASSSVSLTIVDAPFDLVLSGPYAYAVRNVVVVSTPCDGANESGALYRITSYGTVRNYSFGGQAQVVWPNITIEVDGLATICWCSEFADCSLGSAFTKVGVLEVAAGRICSLPPPLKYGQQSVVFSSGRILPAAYSYRQNESHGAILNVTCKSPRLSVPSGPRKEDLECNDGTWLLNGVPFRSYTLTCVDLTCDGSRFQTTAGFLPTWSFNGGPVARNFSVSMASLNTSLDLKCEIGYDVIGGGISYQCKYTDATNISGQAVANFYEPDAAPTGAIAAFVPFANGSFYNGKLQFNCQIIKCPAPVNVSRGSPLYLSGALVSGGIGIAPVGLSRLDCTGLTYGSTCKPNCVNGYVFDTAGNSTVLRCDLSRNFTGNAVCTIIEDAEIYRCWNPPLSVTTVAGEIASTLGASNIQGCGRVISDECQSSWDDALTLDDIPLFCQACRRVLGFRQSCSICCEQCGRVPVVPCDGAYSGSSCRYKCPIGYDVKGTGLVTCSMGNFSLPGGKPPTCIPAACRANPVLQHGRFTGCVNVPHGGTCQVGCGRRTIPVVKHDSGVTRTACSYGTWRLNFTCVKKEIVEAGLPIKVKRGVSVSVVLSPNSLEADSLYFEDYGEDTVPTHFDYKWCTDHDVMIADIIAEHLAFPRSQLQVFFSNTTEGDTISRRALQAADLSLRRLTATIPGDTFQISIVYLINETIGEEPAYALGDLVRSLFVTSFFENETMVVTDGVFFPTLRWKVLAAGEVPPLGLTLATINDTKVMSVTSLVNLTDYVVPEADLSIPAWSACSNTCGEGIRIRDLECPVSIVTGACGTKPSSTQPCEEYTKCVWQFWCPLNPPTPPCYVQQKVMLGIIIGVSICIFLCIVRWCQLRCRPPREGSAIIGVLGMTRVKYRIERKRRSETPGGRSVAKDHIVWDLAPHSNKVHQWWQNSTAQSAAGKVARRSSRRDNAPSSGSGDAPRRPSKQSNASSGSYSAGSYSSGEDPIQPAQDPMEIQIQIQIDEHDVPLSPEMERDLEEPPPPMSPFPVIPDEVSIPAYPPGTQVEYFSVSHSKFVIAILDVKVRERKRARAGDASGLIYSLQIMNERLQAREDVALSGFRPMLGQSELVDIFTKKRGGTWVPGSIFGMQSQVATVYGYRVYLDAQNQEFESIPPTRIRRRYPAGLPVEYYLGSQTGWVPAVVHSLANDPSAARADSSTLNNDSTEPMLQQWVYVPIFEETPGQEGRMNLEGPAQWVPSYLLRQMGVNFLTGPGVTDQELTF